MPQRDQTLDQACAELAALHETLHDLLQQREPAALPAAIVARAAALAATPHSYLYTVTPDQQHAVVQAGTGFFATQIGLRLAKGTRLGGPVWASGHPLIIDDHATWAAAVPGFMPLHAVIGIPLVVGSEIGGVLGLAHLDAAHTFGPADLERLTRFGQLAALVLTNAGRYAAAQQELAAAKEAAVAAGRAKSEFLSLISHELRTPLNAILGFAQILELHDLAPRPRESVGYILQGGRHLLALVDTVLDITGSETGELPLVIEPLPIWTLVEDSLAAVRPLAIQRTVALEAAYPPPDLPLIRTDRRRLRQVLLNLLWHAINDNPAGGRVTVACRQSDPQTLCCTVHDTGGGIAPDQLAHLFAPFDGSGATQPAGGGTSLSLALTKRLVEAMAGRLEVVSVVGQGSAFSVILPLEPPPIGHGSRL